MSVDRDVEELGENDAGSTSTDANSPSWQISNNTESEEMTSDSEESIAMSYSLSNAGSQEELVRDSEEKSLQDLTTTEIMSSVIDLTKEALHLKTENDIFERYLTLNDVGLLDGMEQAIDTALRMQDAGVRRATLLFDVASSMIDSFTPKHNISLHQTSSVFDKGPRINITQKTEMVMREIEETRASLKKFQKDSHKKRSRLMAEIEEAEATYLETADIFEEFERVVITEGLDPLTRRIPAEKFMKFLNDWLKGSLTVIQKLRLKQSTLAVHLRKMGDNLHLKRELGLNLHAVDFEKLRIENDHFVREIDLKTSQLTELKKMDGGANLILTNQKKTLSKQMLEMQKIQKDIDDTKIKIEKLLEETSNAEEQLNKVNYRYDNIKQMIEDYKVPDVMDYVKIKGKLYDLQKNIKIWSRRSHLQDITLNAAIGEMKNLTGSKQVHDSWFKTDNQSSTSLEIDEILDVLDVSSSSSNDSEEPDELL